MKIAYLDPGLTCRKGHNAAMVAEFDHALAKQRRHEVAYVCSAAIDRREFSDIQGSIVPTFRIDGYAKPSATDLFDSERFERIADSLSADLDHVEILKDCDAILMPTAYPLHMEALRRRASTLRGRRVVIGMLLPCSFWGADAASERRIGSLLANSINALSQETDLFAYSETGQFHFDESPVALATLLPPLAEPSAKHVRRLQTESTSVTPNPPALGFFGSPFTSKGFGLLAQAVETFSRLDIVPKMRVVIRLPAGHEQACQSLRALAPWVDATSRQTSNEEYLADMAVVDVVWGFYSPDGYAHKMSGIIPEAISLGKPMLIAEGCHAIQDFLERHAPGSFLCGAYDTQTLADVMMLPAETWARPIACARSHASLMQHLKDMDRYLAVCGLG
jgi:hypothetical protein